MKRTIAVPDVVSTISFLALVLLSPASSRATTYSYTKIADTTDLLSNFQEAPALNDQGTAAFLAIAPNAGACIFTGSGGPLTTIACEVPLGGELDAFPAINLQGAVAFLLTTGQPPNEVQYTMVGSSGPPKVLYSSQTSLFFRFGSPSIDDRELVAFWASTRMESNPWSIFAGDGGPLTTIDRSDVYWSRSFGLFPSLNNAKVVAYLFHFREPGGPGREDAIKTGDGVRTNTLYSTLDNLFGSFADPSLSETGNAAFFATLVSGQSGIFAGNGGPVRTVALTGNVFNGFGLGPSINSGGTVAFSASLTAGGSGIFTGSDPSSDKVIATADDLFGSTVTDLRFFRQGLNAGCQVVFFARLANGTSGIFRADPIK